MAVADCPPQKNSLTRERMARPKSVRWFRTFAMNVSQIYDGEGEPVELKIELEGKKAAN
jgi:hypothetical protein